MDAKQFQRKHKQAVDLFMRLNHGWPTMTEQEVKEMKKRFWRDLRQMEQYIEMQQGEKAKIGQRCQLCERPILVEFSSHGIDHLCRHCQDDLNRYPSND